MENIRIIILACLLCLVNIGKLCAQDGKVLDVPLVKQGNGRDLCWAAVGVEIAQYYYGDYYKNEPITLCNFVAKARPKSCKDCCKEGGLPEKKNDPTNSCIKAASILGEMLPTMKIFGVVCSKSNGNLSFQGCKDQIDLGRPIIVEWTYKWIDTGKGGSHVVVINGYDSQHEKIYYVNSSGDRSIVDYQWMKLHDAANTNGIKWNSNYIMENSPSCERSKLIFAQPIVSNKQIICPNNVEVSSVISAKSVTFEFGNEFTATSGFEVKLGSTVEIKPNTTLKCK